MSLNLPSPPAWTMSALCAQVDPAIFYPAKGDHSGPARAVCGRCIVAEQCLEYALEHDDQHGIYGGLVVRERRAIRDKRAA